MRRAWASAAAIASLAAGCSYKDSLDMEKTGKAAAPSLFYLALSLDACVADPKTCLAELGEAPKVPRQFRLVRLLPSALIWEDLDLQDIRDQDRQTPAGAALTTAVHTLPTLISAAQRAGFKPPKVNVDPACLLPESELNAFYRPSYAASKERALEHVICIGFIPSQKDILPLALDKTVLAHEYFHALLDSTLIQGSVPRTIVTTNHDFEAFNEGLADHFAEIVTKKSLSQWLLQRTNSTWRLEAGRQDLYESAEFFGHIYRDGQRWSTLAGALAKKGVETLPAIRCTLETARNETSALAANPPPGTIEYAWEVNNSHLLAWMRGCLPESSRASFDDLRAAIFHDAAPSTPVAKFEIAAMAIYSRDALCRFAKETGLGASDLMWYQPLDPCAETSFLRFKNAPLDFAPTGPDAWAEETSLGTDPIFVALGARALEGTLGTDCRLRGIRTLRGAEINLANADETRSSLTVNPEELRGSWYTDTAFGSFEGTPAADFALKGPLSALSEVYRFIPTRSLTPTLNGKVFVSALAQMPASTDRDPIVADRVRQVINAENFKLTCSSSGEPVPFVPGPVSVYSCKEGTCSIKSF